MSTQDVSNAYSLVEEVDALEISKEGQESWDAAVRRYNERVDNVEAKIAAALREQLAIAKSANEMFRIFARYATASCPSTIPVLLLVRM